MCTSCAHGATPSPPVNNSPGGPPAPILSSALLVHRGPMTAAVTCRTRGIEPRAGARFCGAWHMRAGTWFTIRNIAATHTSWRRAKQVANRLPEDDPDQLSMQIAPRTLLCGSAWRLGAGGADTDFDELRELCSAAGDQRSLTIVTSGQLVVEHMRLHRAESSRLSRELVRLLEEIGDSTLCATGFRVSGSGFAAGFDELRDLCLAAGDKRSLAIAMSGPLMELSFDACRREASALADEQVRLLDAIDDPTLTLALISAAISVSTKPPRRRRSCGLPSARSTSLAAMRRKGEVLRPARH